MTDLQAAVNRLPWYHRIGLPHGITTPGWAPVNPDFYKLPADLTGKNVLDIGAWDGYWTFEALKRGARYVTAIDDFSNAIYKGEQRGWEQFDLCRSALGYAASKYDRFELSVYNLAQLSFYPFDVALFFGVLYHLKHPLLAIERIYDVLAPGGLLCVESAICDDYSPYTQGGRGDTMVMEFYPDDQLGENATNWWVPTLRTLACMMRVCGFRDIKSWKIDQPSQLHEFRGFVQGTR